jgi:hypothetical protein
LSVTYAKCIPLFSNSSESSGEPWITKQNKPTISFDADHVVLKAGAVNASLNILLSKAPTTTIHAEIFVLDNTAKLGKDFTISQNTITFLPGQKRKSILLTAIKKAITAKSKNATLVIKYNVSVMAGCRQYAKLIVEP